MAKDPNEDMKRQDRERDGLSYALMAQDRTERKRDVDYASWKMLEESRQRRKDSDYASMQMLGEE